MDKELYFVTKQPEPVFNYKKEYLGMSFQLAIFFSPSIGRKRYYRQNLKKPPKGLRLLTFSLKKNAQEVCDSINQVYSENYIVEIYKEK